MDVIELADRQEVIYNSYAQIQDVVWKTCQERWMIGTDEETERYRDTERERERERERESQGNPC